MHEWFDEYLRFCLVPLWESLFSIHAPLCVIEIEGWRLGDFIPGIGMLELLS